MIYLTSVKQTTFKCVEIKIKLMSFKADIKSGEGGLTGNHYVFRIDARMPLTMRSCWVIGVSWLWWRI